MYHLQRLLLAVCYCYEYLNLAILRRSGRDLHVNSAPVNGLYVGPLKDWSKLFDGVLMAHIYIYIFVTWGVAHGE